MAERKRSIEEVFANAGFLEGMSLDAFKSSFEWDESWIETSLLRGSAKGRGWALREMSAVYLTGRLIRWHPGGGHHGPDPYWRISSSEHGRSQLIPSAW